MDEEHMKAHARDFNNELTCHSKGQFSRLNIDTKICKSTLVGLLQIALNTHDSEYQISDIIRFSREGHLSMHSVLHFFPPDIDPDNLKFTQGRYTISDRQMLSHSGFRKKVS